MTQERDGEPPLEAIAEQFSKLWALVSPFGRQPLSPAQTMVLDRLRDALDRGLSRLDDRPGLCILGNTFSTEALVHDGVVTQVYRARHRDLASLHAIKILKPDHADDLLHRTLLLREARIALDLRDDALAQTQMLLRLPDGRPALVMEWLGGSLATRLSGPPLRLIVIRQIMTAVLRGLRVLHDAGFIHGDVTPANILSAETDLGWKLCDFGLSLEEGRRQADLDLSYGGEMQFTSPERKAGAVLDRRCDLYSAGRLLRVLLDRSSETSSDLHAWYRLSDALCADPSDRPANADPHLLPA